MRDRIVSFDFHKLRKQQISNLEIQMFEVKDYCHRMVDEFQNLVKYSENIKFLKYEDLSRQSRNVVKDILAYLCVDCSDKVVDNIIFHSQFKVLSGRSKGNVDASSHFRKGIIGDW